MGKVTFTDTELATSAKRLRKELLMQPVHALSKSLAHMSLRTGIRNEETEAEMDAALEIAPYSETRITQIDPTISPRKLKTYFGSVIGEFSPNSVYQSVWGSAVTKGEALTRVEIVQRMLTLLAASMGETLDMHLFDAVRNADGTKTKDLFDGFDTITANEIDSGAISVALGNLYSFDEAITAVNAVEQLKTFCRAADDLLISSGNLKLIIPWQVYYDYLDDYKATTGAIIYNDKFEQIHVEGFKNIELVPMYQKKGSEFIQLTSKNNLLVGVNQEGEEEDIRIEKHHAFILQFIATMFFGVNYRSISKKRLLVGQLASEDKEQEPPSEDETKGGDEEGDNN